MDVTIDYSALGDPEGMEALAAELLLRAETIGGAAQSLARRVEAMSFEGPAAAGLRQKMTDRTRRAERVALQLQERAVALRRAAGRAHDEILELRRLQIRSAEEGGDLS